VQAISRSQVIQSMHLSDVDESALRAALAGAAASFRTRDVSANPRVVERHGVLAESWAYHAVIGRYLATHQARLGIRLVAPGTGRAGALWEKVPAGALWQEALAGESPREDALAGGQAHVEAAAPGVRQEISAVRAGHFASLAYMASDEFSAIKTILDAVPQLGGVYFRPTDRGVIMVDLHADSLKPRVGIGSDALLRSGTSAEAVRNSLPTRLAHLLAVRARQQLPSRENQLEARLIREAQANHLRLPGFPDAVRFVHSQWRLHAPGQRTQSYTDLIAVDIASRRLVIIELKAFPSTLAAAQVRAYASYFELHAQELLPFFGQLARVMGKLYDCPELLEVDVAGDVEAMTAWMVDDALLVERILLDAQAQPVRPEPPVPPAADWTSDSAINLGPQFPLDPPFRARMRLHQSWWRATRLCVPSGSGPRSNSTSLYGNMLPHEAAVQGKNFLSDQIFQIARARLAERRGAVEPYRLLHNLLSSQPMCFNLFGPPAANPELATRLFRRLWPDEVARVTAIRFEYAPAPASEYLNDRTAFDVFVEYVKPDGHPAFVGVEAKLSEPFSPTVYDSERYRQVTRTGGVWKESAESKLADTRWNQLWRDHLLVHATQHHPSANGYAGRLLVVHHPLDQDAKDAIRQYRDLLIDTDRTLMVMTLDQLLSAWRQGALAVDEQRWLEAFEERYLAVHLSEGAWRRPRPGIPGRNRANSGLVTTPADPDLLA
jgi:hypothetical protein